jgi:hypothetical protein
MKPINLSRLHSLRMACVERGYTMDDMRPRFAALASRHEDGTAPQAIAVHQLFQTPPDLARELVSLLPSVAGMRILEPSAGLGRLLDALAPLDAAEIVAVEKAPECAGELFRQERERLTIKQRDFLSLTQSDLGTFDAVAMNPPFTMRSDIRHILHALTFLKSGGTLSALCMAGAQREKILRPLSSTWKEIPAGAFRSEGTNIPTILLSIIKP